MKTLHMAVPLGVLLGIASTAVAQSYPTHAVSMIVPYAAGGPTDTIARIVSERMSRSLGQTVVVENTTGAGGSIGVGKVAPAAPDGYALSIGNIGLRASSNRPPRSARTTRPRLRSGGR